MRKTTIRNQKDEVKLQEVITLLVPAAKAGYSSACSYLGYCYLEGLGVQKNDVEAVKMLKLSLENGKESGYAYMLLGDCHKEGLGGLEESNSKARDFYRKARDYGYDIGNRLKTGCFYR